MTRRPSARKSLPISRGLGLGNYFTLDTASGSCLAPVCVSSLDNARGSLGLPLEPADTTVRKGRRDLADWKYEPQIARHTISSLVC